MRVVARLLFGFCCLLPVVFATPAARADGELHLSWDDCRITGTTDAASVCLLNEGASELFCAFILDAPIDDVLGVEVVVDLQHSGGQLPDWWRLQGKGECRDGTLSVSGDFTSNGICIDPWSNLGGGLVLYDPGLPRGQPSQARFHATYAIPSEQAREIGSGKMTYGLKIVIRNDKTVFPFECPGCALAACLVLNQITLLRPPGAEPPEVPLIRPGVGDANRVTWKGGTNADCTAVPVRKTTWGQVKSLSR